MSENVELYSQLNRWESEEDVHIDSLLVYEVMESLHLSDNEILASELADWANELKLHPDDFDDLPGEDLLQVLLGVKTIQEVL